MQPWSWTIKEKALEYTGVAYVWERGGGEKKGVREESERAAERYGGEGERSWEQGTAEEVR